MTKPFVKVDIDGHGVVKTFAVDPQNTFKDLCGRVVEALAVQDKEFQSYRIFLIETSSDGLSLLYTMQVFLASFFLFSFFFLLSFPLRADELVCMMLQLLGISLWTRISL